jgi:hypothetical protein
MYPIFAEFMHAENRWQVCLADCPDYLDYDLLSDLLYTEHLRGLEHTDILIVRPRVDQPRLSGSIIPGDFQALRKRAPRSSLHVLFTDDYKVELSSNLNNDVDDKLHSDEIRKMFLQWLQDKELYQYVKQSNGLFQAKPQFVYKVPSQRFVNMFLRVGNVQRDRQVLDAFFFWMLPFLKERNAILTDTWSISSIALNAGRFLERYWSTLSDVKEIDRTSEENKCRIDMLSRYPDTLALLSTETRDALQRVSEDGKRKVLVLLSAVATGNSLARLRETVAQLEQSGNDFAFLALYKLCADCTVPYLCDLSSGIGRMKFSAIPKREIGSRTIIEIDRGTYFPLEVKETALEIKQAHAAPAKDFFTRYRNCSAVSLHRDALDLSHQEHRHHGIYVDIEPMLRQSEFLAKLQAEVNQLDKKPALIITPPHRAGTAFAKRAQEIMSEKWGQFIEILVHPDLHPSTAKIPEQLRHANHEDVILIVDDVSVTGKRLARYQQSLRELSYPGRIIYLIGVARPEAEKNWIRRQKELAYRAGSLPKHKIISLEHVVLPDWDRKTCPWCVETKVLTQLKARGRLTDATISAVTKRVMILEKARRRKGLISNAIWRPDGSNPTQLSQNSIFVNIDSGPATEADVIAAVGAALQRMRTTTSDHEERLESGYPHVSILDPENYFGFRFNDDLLRLAILRSANVAELERWVTAREEERRKKVKEFLLGTSNQDVFRLELAIAHLSRKIPYPELSDEDWETMEGWPAKLWAAFVEI